MRRVRVARELWAVGGWASGLHGAAALSARVYLASEHAHAYGFESWSGAIWDWRQQKEKESQIFDIL